MNLPTVPRLRLKLPKRALAKRSFAKPSLTKPTFTKPTLTKPTLSFGFLRNVVRGIVLPLMLVLVLFAGLVYFFFPTATWLDQRAEAAEVQAELEVLQGEQAVLRNEISRMRTDDEVERIARRDFNFVFPGEEAYAVLPAPPAPVSLPSSWPFNLLYAEVLD